jgi:HlyD family secretion protein
VRKNLFGVLLVILISGSLAIPQVGCGSKTAADANDQLVSVRRGDITIDITGAGNLALTKTEDLAFEIAGYVQEVSVKEGEAVKEGQIVAQLDTSEWEKQLKTLQKTLDSSQRNLTSAQSNVTKAQRNVTTAEDKVTKARRNLAAVESSVAKAESQVATREFALRQSQLDLETAKYNLGQISEVKTAQDMVDSAENALEHAQASFKLAKLQGAADEDMPREITYLSAALEKAQGKLQDILRGKNLSISSTVAIQIAQSQLRVEQNQKSLNDAQIAIEEAKTAVADARFDVEDAKLAVDSALSDVEDVKSAVNNAMLDQKNAEQNTRDAQVDLDEAKNLSPLVKAPFDGFITKVNVSGGDEVQKGTIAMQLADPAKFTADIVVGESDITKVKEGGAATVQVDPIAGLTLPATVTHISPTGTIQSGVVNFKVTVEMENLPRSLPPVPAQPAATRDPSPAVPAPVPDQTPRRFPFGRANQSTTGQPGAALAAPVSRYSQIRAGMSVTVSIAVSESRDVVLVPNQAIIYSGRTTQVRVMKDGVEETRTIKTGINNWQYTEVTEGLSEGEQVIFPTSNTGSIQRPAQTSRPGQSFNLPGGGGVRLR